MNNVIEIVITLSEDKKLKAMGIPTDEAGMKIAIQCLAETIKTVAQMKPADISPILTLKDSGKVTPL